ncbi:MAG: hypothetical protein WA917_13590 [Comamonas sp.]
MTLPVKWFSSDWRGAPIINGQAGSLISALEACLLTGFGEITATSVTVSGGIATAVHNSGDWFADHAVIAISGATPAGLNGESRVLSHTSTTTTWATTAADGAATGVIKIRYAPVGGWEVAFSKTNVRVLRSTDLQAHGHYLRVDDSATTYARVRGYETMSDVDTGTGPFPTDAQMSGGGYWHKSSAANATANTWWLAADSRSLLPAIAAGSGANATNNAAAPYFWGDLVPLAPGGDAYASALQCNWTSTSSQDGSFVYTVTSTATSGALFLPRVYNGSGSSVMVRALPYLGVTNSPIVSGGSNTFGAAPGTADGAVILSSLFVIDTAGSAQSPRADVPGVYFIPQSGALAMFVGGAIESGGASLGNRELLMLYCGFGSGRGAAAGGVYAVDITGPWHG